MDEKKVSDKEIEEFKEKIYSKTFHYQKKPYQVINNFYTIITIVLVCIAILWYINKG